MERLVQRRKEREEEGGKEVKARRGGNKKRERKDKAKEGKRGTQTGKQRRGEKNNEEKDEKRGGGGREKGKKARWRGLWRLMAERSALPHRAGRSISSLLFQGWLQRLKAAGARSLQLPHHKINQHLSAAAIAALTYIIPLCSSVERQTVPNPIWRSGPKST